MTIPLLIGGATTSRCAHRGQDRATAFRPGDLGEGRIPLGTGRRRAARRQATARAARRHREDYASLRARHAEKNERPMLTLGKPAPTGRRSTGRATRRCPRRAWACASFRLRPRRTAGVHRLAAVLQRLGDEGPLPRHPQQPGRRRSRRRKLYDDAQVMLDTVIKEKWLTANGVIGFFPANAVGDDIEVSHRRDPHRGADHVAQPAPAGRAPDGIPNRSLGDYIAPRSGLADYVGAFAVTAGLGSGEIVGSRRPTTTTAQSCWSPRRPAAEAFAERMHQRVRPNSGATPDEQTGQRGAHRGEVRRHPSRPRLSGLPRAHREATLFELMDVTARTGIELTESMAMWPGAAVSGWYFSHPQSQYFVVGRLARDQVADYAKRRAGRWPRPSAGSARIWVTTRRTEPHGGNAFQAGAGDDPVLRPLAVGAFVPVAPLAPGAPVEPRGRHCRWSRSYLRHRCRRWFRWSRLSGGSPGIRWPRWRRGCRWLHWFPRCLC